MEKIRMGIPLQMEFISIKLLFPRMGRIKISPRKWPLFDEK
jgi:hypothetical protein